MTDIVGIVCESRNTFLACDSLLRAGKYRYMASVVTLASDEKETAVFGCRWMPKRAHSQLLHVLMACTEYNGLFYIRGDITSMTGVIGRGSRFPGQSAMQFSSVVN